MNKKFCFLMDKKLQNGRLPSIPTNLAFIHLNLKCFPLHKSLKFKIYDQSSLTSNLNFFNIVKSRWCFPLNLSSPFQLPPRHNIPMFDGLHCTAAQKKTIPQENVFYGIRRRMSNGISRICLKIRAEAMYVKWNNSFPHFILSSGVLTLLNLCYT
jgi:hypothetical protein